MKETKLWLRKLGKALACGSEFFECDGGLWPIEQRGPVKGVQIGRWLYLQQNKLQSSKWAKLARDGARVIQIKKNNRYWGVIVNSSIFVYEGENQRLEGRL